MKKILIVLAAAFLAFGFTPGVSGTMNGPVSPESGDLTAAPKDAGAWVGKDVINLEGEVLGDIKDFVRDESGAIVLAIVTHDEKDVAVPFSALSFDESEDHAVLDATMDQLANAPEIEPGETISDSDLASIEEVYRHFGERPYWGEQTGAEEPGSFTYYP